MERIGRYLVESLIGEGTFGSVWLAHDPEHFERPVAIKVLKDGRRSRAIHSRFLAEQMALGMMEHDNIAKIFESGRDAEQPYFVMEYVDGVPLTTYCDDRRLDLAARLDLLAAICAGVQHAHQKGVIHRDLKPSNVLVTERDGRAVPKIIDFGLARGEDRLLFEDQLPTLDDQVLGTLVYMSPEQARGARHAVDTRTDVYSLGVVLYELVAGLLPFEFDDSHATGLATALARITAGDPPRPSRRFAELLARDPGAAEALATRRRTRPGALLRALGGDLDWIVLAALDADRERRYATAHELADDLRRYVDLLPVVARPPSRGYRLRKFVRRHALQVAAVSTVVVLSVGVAVFATMSRVAAEESARLSAEVALRVAREHFRAGESAARRGRWTDALSEYAAADANGYEDPVELALARVEALHGGSEHGRAVAELHELVAGGAALGPHLGRALLLQVDVDWVRIDASDARLALAERALATGGLSPADAEYARAILAPTSADALAHLALARQHDPLHRRANDMLAIALLCVGRLAEARAFAQALTSLYPDDPPVLVYTGFVAALDGERERAEACLAEVERRFPDHAELASFTLRVGDLVESFNRFEMDHVVKSADTSWGSAALLITRAWALFAGLGRAIQDGEAAPAGTMFVRLPPCVVRAYAPLIGRDAPRSAVGVRDTAETDGIVHFAAGVAELIAGRILESVAAMRRATERPSVVLRHKTALFHLINLAGVAHTDRSLSEADRTAMRATCLETVERALALPALGDDDLRFLDGVARFLGSRTLVVRVATRWLAQDSDGVSGRLSFARTLVDAHAGGAARDIVDAVATIAPHDQRVLALRARLDAPMSAGRRSWWRK